jgi:hypothetical protein
MKSERSLASGRTVFAIVSVLIAWLSLFLVSAGAQSAGQNGVYNSSGGSVVNSSAFIDASVFAASGRDFCGVLNYILSPGHGYPAAGAVIDARGLLSSTPPTSMTCAASPWAGITGPPPATILLPSGTIVIQGPGWILPPNTRLIGVGNDDVATGRCCHRLGHCDFGNYHPSLQGWPNGMFFAVRRRRHHDHHVQ